MEASSLNVSRRHKKKKTDKVGQSTLRPQKCFFNTLYAVMVLKYDYTFLLFNIAENYHTGEDNLVKMMQMWVSL